MQNFFFISFNTGLNMSLFLNDIVMKDFVSEKKGKDYLLNQFRASASEKGSPCFHIKICFHPLERLW
jgi:hypothetical protein